MQELSLMKPCSPLLQAKKQHDSMRALYVTENEFKRRFPRATASTLKVQRFDPPPAPLSHSDMLVVNEAKVLVPCESTDVAKLNKTERAYYEYLLGGCYYWVGVQNITLKLANDTRYTPDFFTFNGERLEAHEVKGFWRDDAKVKIKVAARMFPFIKFTVAKKLKGISGGWEMETVVP